MRARRFFGWGGIAGFGFGQTTAWLLVRTECPHASGLVALSSFGPGMLAFILVMALITLVRSDASKP